MKITFSIRISGCATKCWHCYVNGGPGRIMKYNEYKKCLNVISELISYLENEDYNIDLFLDYEPLLHPDIIKIINLTAYRMEKNYNFKNMPWSTTGIPISKRNDYKEIMKSLKNIDVNSFMISFHGSAKTQIEALKYNNVDEVQIDAMEKIKEAGFGLVANFIISQSFIKDFQSVYKRYQKFIDTQRFIVPLFVPTTRLRKFEKQRATVNDLIELNNLIKKIGLKGDYDMLDKGKITEKKVYNNVREKSDIYSSFEKIENRQPDWIFISILPGLDIYYGNTGSENFKLGNLYNDKPAELYKKIKKLKSNYCFRNYYRIDKLPKPSLVAKKYGDPKGNKVYASEEDVLLKWVDKFVQAIV